jgi:molybdopterin converting factor small subunit
MVNKNEEVEFCNLELRFDHTQIHHLIRDLIGEGYSLYWSENDTHFMVSVRSGRKLVKLKFERMGERYKMVGDYVIKDEKLSQFLERIINDTRGHAVVKRFSERQILIENIMFGEIIRLVEISGMEHRVIYQKKLSMTTDEVWEAFLSTRVEEEISVVQGEVNYELSNLSEALEDGDQLKKEAALQRLEYLRIEMMRLEV